MIGRFLIFFVFLFVPFLSFGAGSQEIWFQVNEYKSNQLIWVSTGGWSTPNCRAYVNFPNSSNVELNIYDAGCGGAGDHATSELFSTSVGEWYKIVVEGDGTDWNLFIDDVEIVDVVASSWDITNFELWNETNAPGCPWYLDDSSVCSTDAPEEEIQEDPNATSTAFIVGENYEDEIFLGQIITFLLTLATLFTIRSNYI